MNAGCGPSASRSALAAVRTRVLVGMIALTSACAPSPAPPRPQPLPQPTPTPAPIPVNPPVTLHPAEGRIETGSAGSLWYRIDGSASDTVLVPLGIYLRDALGPLAASHTVVFYDPRSRGRSDRLTDSTLSTFDGDVSDLEAVRRGLGISRAAVVGFSYFAAVAVAYAAAHPDRISRIVLLSPIEPNDSLERTYDPAERRSRIDTTSARALLKLRAAGRDTSDPAGYCAAFWHVNAPLFVGDPSRAARLTPSWCEYPAESPRAMGEHVTRVMTSLGTRRDFSTLSPRVTAPVLVMHGDRDLVANPAGGKAWTRILPQAREWTHAGAGHFLFVDDRDAVVRTIDRFLKGEWP